MAYIGKNPTTGSFLYADDITTSSTNTYNILVGGVAFSPESANHCIVSLNGVIQKANTSFSISGSQITFLPSSGTLSSSDSIDFILILGSVNDVGVATTVTDSAITKGKLNLISDSSSAGLTVKGDGSSENGTIQLNCSQNSHGVKISSPAHSAGQSYELILPTGNVTADKVLKVASVSGSGATGVGQLSFGDAGGQNTPNFHVYRNGNQSISNNTATKIQFNAETYDTANAFDSSSNYRYTPQTSGKYYLYAHIYIANGSSASMQEYSINIYKNGSKIAGNSLDHRTSGLGYNFMVPVSTVVESNGSSDYYEVYANVNWSGGSQNIVGSASQTFFGGYKLIE